ncbi:L-lactate dehydrogenase [Candidatus Woesearchaeota archaeon]|nr:L-lactate dehydrogenase [Candidatus Woesearchaeota archaeon]
MASKQKTKVAIVGTGFVGATAAYALCIDGIASEIALIDMDKKRAEGEALDLIHGTLFTSNTKITYGNTYRLCKGADIIVITAGAHQKEGETRLDLVKKNASILQQIIAGITANNHQGIIIIVSNPLDVLTSLALQWSGFPKERVFGTGTMLDTARFRHYLSEYYEVNPSSVHAYILGEHGDSEFPAWSCAHVGGVPLKSFERYNPKELSKIAEKTRNAAYEIIAKKGATYYAIGLVITKLVRTILTDQRHVLPVSCLLENYYAINNICLSIPAVIGRQGILKKIKIPLNKKEQQQLKRSANIVKAYTQIVEKHGN